MADQSSKLRRLDGNHIAYAVDLWLLSHPDIARAKRVEVCMSLLVNALKQLF
jgi:hypothetical protein